MSQPRAFLIAARLLGACLTLTPVAVIAAACEPVKLPHEQPGPAGCGLRDPRTTSPGMLSIAQKEAYRLNGSPDEVRKNKHGGLDWLYERSQGSVFGEQKTVEIFSFSGEGILVERDTDVLMRVGK